MLFQDFQKEALHLSIERGADGIAYPCQAGEGLLTSLALDVLDQATRQAQGDVNGRLQHRDKLF